MAAGAVCDASWFRMHRLGARRRSPKYSSWHLRT